VIFCNPKLKVLTKDNMKSPLFEQNEKIRLNLEFKHNNTKLTFIPSKTEKVDIRQQQQQLGSENKEIKIER
jgi:hypothetical protein